MTKKTVMVTKPLHLDALRRLEQEVEVLAPFEASHDQILALLPGVHGVVLGGAFQMGPQALDQAAMIEVVGRHGVGLDNVDITAASERRIPVTYTPYGPTESTAEHALLLILATARRLAQLDRAVRGGNWPIRNRLEVMGRELDGMTLGVVGFGRIGQRLAEMCRDALHMEVRVYDPYVDSETVAAWGAEHGGGPGRAGGPGGRAVGTRAAHAADARSRQPGRDPGTEAGRHPGQHLAGAAGGRGRAGRGAGGRSPGRGGDRRVRSPAAGPGPSPVRL